MADHDLDNHMVIDADREYEEGPNYWLPRRSKRLRFELHNGIPQPVIDTTLADDAPALLKPQVE